MKVTVVLAKAHRVLSATDFRATVRQGRRVVTPLAVIYRADTAAQAPTRFGFIVAKTVGNAVVRNTMRRRLRSIGRDILDDPSIAVGSDVVVRALPASAEVDWATLHEEISDAVRRSVARR